ncbi:MAG: hypothetical protein IJ404_00440 [Clostridia bacterium]|nr:hypothetical protein [Clostridia bacterium]
MYANIGKKIMILAVVIAIIMMIVSALHGVILLIKGQGVIGVITMVFGPFVSWIAGFFIYGFGRLIDNTDYIARKMGRRDGFGIPDVSDKLDWSTPEEDETVEEPVTPPNFIAQRVVTEKDPDKDN